MNIARKLKRRAGLHKGEGPKIEGDIRTFPDEYGEAFSIWEGVLHDVTQNARLVRDDEWIARMRLATGKTRKANRLVRSIPTHIFPMMRAELIKTADLLDSAAELMERGVAVSAPRIARADTDPDSFERERIAKFDDNLFEDSFGALRRAMEHVNLASGFLHLRK